jgi:hypothetical protein
MKYTLAPLGGVIRDDGANIPPDPSNRDWQDYLAWVAEGNTPDPIPPPTPAEIQAANQAHRNALLANATAAMGPLQDAVDLDEATAAEAAMLTAWKQFRVAVNRVDLTLTEPVWPVPPSGSNYSSSQHAI